MARHSEPFYSPQDIYARHLVSRRGYPLWTPEPDRSLPDVYISEGLKIGDVGVVVPRDGSFDVFFNMCLPPDHPLHRETGVPNNFTHLPLSGRDIAIFPEAESAGRIISTSSVTRVRDKHASEEDVERRARPGPLNYEFTLSSHEGAVLVLPEGAERYYLRNEHIFKDEAIRHAVDWYAFAEQRLGRMINHDSLYLITGFYKARSWSLAAYQQSSGAAEASAQFRATQVGQGDVMANYTWETTNAMDWRVGPSNLYYTGTPNQSVFIEGFKIAVRETALLRRKRVNVTADFPSVQTYHGDSSSSSRSLNLWGARGRSTSSGGPAANAQVSDGFTNTMDSAILADGTEYSNEDIMVQRFPQVAKPFHPSDVINQYLLEKFPFAVIAVTHDVQWTTLLEKELLDPEELSREGCLRNAIRDHKVIFKDGAVYLISEERPPQKEDLSRPRPESSVGMIGKPMVGRQEYALYEPSNTTRNDATTVRKPPDLTSPPERPAADVVSSKMKDSVMAVMGPAGSAERQSDSDYSDTDLVSQAPVERPTRVDSTTDRHSSHASLAKGSKVFFWTSSGEIKRGIVISQDILEDRSPVVLVALEGGEGYRALPLSSVSEI